MFFFNFIICNDRLSLCCDVNIWQNIFNQKIWFGLLSWRYIYCSDRLLWIEFVDFFFFVWFSSAFKFAKIYNIFEYDLFHYPFYSNENLLLMFYKFFYAISNLPKFITILKKFISHFPWREINLVSFFSFLRFNINIHYTSLSNISLLFNFLSSYIIYQNLSTFLQNMICFAILFARMKIYCLCALYLYLINFSFAISSNLPKFTKFISLSSTT